MKTSKTRGESRSKLGTIRIWKVTDVHTCYPPSNYQYMNPASYGQVIKDADSTLSYSSSENWYKRRPKNSKSSNRSSGRGDSGNCDKVDPGFLKNLLHKNEDFDSLKPLLGSRRIEHSISKFSSHLNLNEPANMKEIIEDVEENTREPEKEIKGI